MGLTIIGLLTFGWSLNDFFLSDDFDWLFVGAGLSGPWWKVFFGNYFGQHAAGGSFRPLVAVLFHGFYAIAGMAPWFYHAVALVAHTITAYLLYRVVAKLMPAYEKWGIVAAVIFMLMPHHAEPVIWIAAIADPIVAALTLGALLLYVGSKTWSRKYWLSLLCVALAFGFKEIAVVIPLLMIGYELIIDRQVAWKQRIARWWPFIALVLMYVLYRSWAIGMVAGYYAQSSLAFQPKMWLQTLINIVLLPFVTQGPRITIAQFLVTYWFIPVFSMVAIAAWWLWSFFKQKNTLFVYGVWGWVSLTAIVIPVGVSMGNDEGERYAYAPSLVVAIFLAFLLQRVWQRSRIVAGVFLLILVPWYGWQLGNKIHEWNTAGEIAERIYQEMPRDLVNVKKIFVVGLPGNYHDAQLMRNGFVTAYQLLGGKVSVERIAAYVDIDDGDWQSSLYEPWQWLPDRVHVEMKDKAFILTGNATETHPEYVYELWNYDYEQQNANTLRIIFKNGRQYDYARDEIAIFYFDNGHMQRLQR